MKLSTRGLRLIFGTGLASDSTGIKASYAVPASRKIAVRDIRITRITGGTVAVEITDGTNTHTLRSTTATFRDVGDYYVIDDGDTIQFNVTTAGAAGSVFDAEVSGEVVG